ncbi:hypothetical protein D1007_17382 [Hordeum vulgare]|nr:hypothetical protein D1007_17382 [Hordeum vulgare]
MDVMAGLVEEPYKASVARKRRWTRAGSDLRNNRLDGHIPPELSGLESLTLLDLQNNSLTDGLPEFVKGMPTLQDLLFSSNPLLGEAP